MFLHWLSDILNIEEKPKKNRQATWLAMLNYKKIKKEMNDDISSTGWVSNPSKKAFDRLHCIFHFDTENGEDQLKNTLHKYDWEGGSGKISWRSRGRSGRLANFWLASSREASPPNSVQQKVAKHWTSKQPPKQSKLKEEKNIPNQVCWSSAMYGMHAWHICHISNFKFKIKTQ